MNLNSARRAALLIHSLGVAERAAVLGDIDPDKRELVQALLTELEALGIPRDRSLLDEALSNRGTSEAATPMVDDDATLVAQASADQMIVLLLREPAAIVQRIVGAAAWPWREAVGRRFAIDPVFTTASEFAAPSRVTQALLHALAQQLRRQPAADAAPLMFARTPRRVARGRLVSLFHRMARAA